VEIGFDGSGKDAWFQLTKKAYEADPSQSTLMCQQVNVDRGCNEIAMTLDGVVLSAPSSQQDGIPGGQTQITGAFTKQRAQSLVEVLKYGALPVRIVIQTVTTS
jgi:preprotein translocase subunit SecD